MEGLPRKKEEIFFVTLRRPDIISQTLFEVGNNKALVKTSYKGEKSNLSSVGRKKGEGLLLRAKRFLLNLNLKARMLKFATKCIEMMETIPAGTSIFSKVYLSKRS